MIEFQPFPKLPRISRGSVITEKLDGTNAQIIIRKLQHETPLDGEYHRAAGDVLNGEVYIIGAGSRSRLIKPGKLTDNFGFAQWVWDNADELVKLGEGRHFGEWYGNGIQRGYGLSERRFALFNTHRWAPGTTPKCVGVVPTLYRGEFSSEMVDHCMRILAAGGSQAAPGFKDPEGIVIYHEAARVSFKKTFDDQHKEAA